MPAVTKAAMNANDAHTEAVNRIETCLRYNGESKFLDLGGLGLTEVPVEVGKLRSLQTLSLANNLLTQLPPEIGDLESLQFLYLHNNNLTKLPPAIGRLTSLRQLTVSTNNLTVLPPEIGNLNALTALHLRSNNLNSLPIEISRLGRLRELYLHDNPDLGLPAEVLGARLAEGGSWNLPAIPQDLIAYYFRNNAAISKQPILEAKVIFVGWGMVGKTSLRRRLIDGSFDISEQQTHKIEITSWPVTIGTDEVKLHLWDFGGQEIMHSTHQFFLTKRSLYVLVLAGREKTQGARDAEYWLRLIGSFGGGSPALVVLNKQHGYPFDLNRQSLMDKYPFIRGFVQTDCAPPLGLDILKQKIIEEVDKLPDLRTEFDERWMAIKEAVTDLKRKGERRMPVANFRALCAQKHEREERWQQWLLGFLHDLGTVVCFHDDPRLANDGVLDPQWVVDGIYTVLNNNSLKGGDGQITRKQVRELLPRYDYDDDDVRVLLELMEKFELCFRPTNARDVLIVPELMTEQEAEWKPLFPELAKCLLFELKYDFLPEGLMPRFIVATHDLSRPGQRWRSGVILHSGKNLAVVRGDPVEGRITISVSGPEPTRRDLLAVIRRDFTKINHSISGLVVKERVPVPGFDVEPLDYEHLIAAEEAGDKEWPVVSKGIRHKLLIERLLNGIEPKEKRKARRKASYAGDNHVHIQGDYIAGVKQTQIRIDGDNYGQIGERLTNCSNRIRNHSTEGVAALLTKLEYEVQSLIKRMPENKKEHATKHWETLVEAATSEMPDRKWYSVSAKGLLEAATWVKDFTGNISGTLANLKRMLWPSGET